MEWRMLSWHLLGVLIPIKHCLNATVYLSIAADNVQQLYYVPNRFTEHDDDFNGLSCQNPGDLGGITMIWRFDFEHEGIATNLQQLCDVILST